MNPKKLVISLALALSLLLSGCASSTSNSLLIYSGRSEELVGPLIEKFEAESGISVDVRYAETASLTAQLLEEGENTPADIFLSQDAGALGSLSNDAMLVDLPDDILELVAPEYRSTVGDWVGFSGRARVLAFVPDKVPTVPTTVLELAKPEWKGKIAIAPSNASFQAFVTALRILEGEQAASEWLAAMKQNAVIFENNSAILDAIESGQVAAGLINHYYWYARLNEVGYENLKSRVTFFEPGDAGNLINVAGAGILRDSENAKSFMRFMLSPESQNYFVAETSEYPLLIGSNTDANPALLPLSDVPSPEINLGDLSDLNATLELIRSAGLL